VTGKRVRLPWKVVFLTAGGPLPEEKFSTETKAYVSVNFAREQIRDGISRISRCTVYQWDKSAARWMTFDRHNLKAEAEKLSPRTDEDPS
jgi:hypothetical protein